MYPAIHKKVQYFPTTTTKKGRAVICFESVVSEIAVGKSFDIKAV